MTTLVAVLLAGLTNVASGQPARPDQAGELEKVFRARAEQIDRDIDRLHTAKMAEFKIRLQGGRASAALLARLAAGEEDLRADLLVLRVIERRLRTARLPAEHVKAARQSRLRLQQKADKTFAAFRN
jgi:hypothetical protein